MTNQVETRVPKDIRQYKTKILGPLTLRQLICITIAGVIDVILYMTVLKHLSMDIEITVYSLVFLNLPIFLFMTEPQGLKFEVFLKEVVFKMFFYPRYRRPVTVINPNQPVCKDIRPKKETKRLMKEHPQLKRYK